MLNIDQLLKESERIEPVPQVIHQLMDLADDPDVPASEIAELILYEPVVTANLLKMANSAMFGFKVKIDSVHDAVVRMGLKRVVELALMSSVTKSLKSNQKGYGLEDGQLWKQSVSCALMASAAADKVDSSIKHVVFTAALLKDIGVIVMDRHIRAVAAEIQLAMQDGGLDLVAAERQVLGIDHADLGARIARTWNLSETLADAIHNHHLSDDLPEVSTETALVYIADSICTLSGINAEMFCGDTGQQEYLCAQVGLSESEVNRIMSDFYSQKENIYGLLSIL